MKLAQYVARPFTINAVRVTEENFNEVSEWCGGTNSTDDQGKFYIKIDVKRPLGERQTRAYIGDWVLSAKGGFKTYDDKSFKKSFVPKRKSVKAEIVNMTIHNYNPGQDSPRIDAPESTDESPRLQVTEDGNDSPPVQV